MVKPSKYSRFININCYGLVWLLKMLLLSLESTSSNFRQVVSLQHRKSFLPAVFSCSNLHIKHIQRMWHKFLMNETQAIIWGVKLELGIYFFVEKLSTWRESVCNHFYPRLHSLSAHLIFSDSSSFYFLFQ